MSIASTVKNKLSSKYGLICLITAQFCICINIVVNKYLVKRIPGLTLLTLRFIIGAVILYSLFLYREKKLSLTKVFKDLCHKSKLSIIIQGLLGGFLFNFLMLSGLKLTSATMAGILSSLVPALIILFSYFILKETVAKNEILSIFIAAIGIIFINISKISGPGFGLHILGDLLILLALFPEALYTIVAKLHPVDLCPITSTTLVTIINAIAFCLTLLVFPTDIQAVTAITLFDWFLIVAFIASAGVLFFILWNIGLQHSTTQQAGIVTAVVPAGSCLLAVMFLHEHISLYELVGISMVIAAIYVGATNSQNSSAKKSKTNTENKSIEDNLAIESGH